MKKNKFFVSTVALIRQDGAALFQHRDDKPNISRPGAWVFPGGRNDSEAESEEDCARRELLEETGYVCSDLYFLARVEDDDELNKSKYSLVIFYARYDGKQECHCFEGQEVRFIGRQEAHNYEIPTFLIENWDRILYKLEISVKDT